MASGFPASAVAVAVVLAATGAPSLAYAERRPVAVISVSTDSDATDLAQKLYSVLRTHPDLQPLSVGDPVRDARLNAALQGAFEDEDQLNLATARQARAEADSDLDLATPDFRAAASAASRGTNALALVSPSPAMLQLYADLMFDLGYAQLGLGNNVEASRSFALTRRLDPNRKVDRAQYPSEIADAYDATANLHVSKSPLEVLGKGTIWIDGVQHGEAPQKVDIDDGIHLVGLTGPDREPRGEQVRVPQTSQINIADAPATEELEVKRARRELAEAKDSLTRASAVKRLAALVSVGDAVIISKSSGGALLIQTWRDNEQGFSAIREHATEKPLDLLTPLAPPRPKEPIKPIEIEPKKVPIVIEKPWYQKTWVRASAATGIVAIVVSAILIARRDEMVDFNNDIKPGMK